MQNQDNLLIRKILAFASDKGLSINQVAMNMGLSEVYLNALLNGTRDIKDLPLSGFRKIATELGMPTLSAMVMAGALTMNDFIESL